MRNERLLVVLIVSVTAACASDPAKDDPVLGENFDRIEVINPTDNTLSCDDLKAQINTMGDDTKKMDHQIDYWQKKSQSDAAMAAISTGYASSGMQMMSQQDSQKAMTIQQIEASYQKRHDYLTQISLTKKCN